MIKENQGTHGEPGHALTGTTPFHVNRRAVEKPAYVYVSEISHNFRGKSYFYAGGYYSRLEYMTLSGIRRYLIRPSIAVCSI